MPYQNFPYAFQSKNERNSVFLVSKNLFID